MASTSHQVIALFAEPLFKASIAGAISPEQIDFIRKLKMRDNIENLISENKYIFEEPQLKSIKDAVQEVLKKFSAEKFEAAVIGSLAAGPARISVS